MAQNANPYYVKPPSIGSQPILQGIGAISDAWRENIKKEQDAAKREELKSKMTEAFSSDDPAKRQEFVAEYPQLAEVFHKEMGYKNAETKKNYMSSMRDILAVEDLYGNDSDKSVRNEKVGNLINNRLSYLNDNGVDNQEQTQQALSSFMRDPDGFMNDVKMEYASMASPQEYEEYMRQNGGSKNDKELIEFRKEERKNASQDVRSFNKQAKEMRGSYMKLQGLADEADKGNRGARNAMVVSLSRLISPGIVTETEAASLSGGQNTMQFVLGSLMGKDPKLDNLLKGVDPYGESFDAQGLLRVGDSVVASSRQPLIDMYEGSRTRAERSGMGKAAFNTNFGENANYDFLSSFQTNTERADAAAPAPAQAQAPAPAPVAAPPAEQPQQLPMGAEPIDMQAIEWLKANPNHPSAEGVRAKLQRKGLI